MSAFEGSIVIVCSSHCSYINYTPFTHNVCTHTHTEIGEAVNKDKFPLVFSWINLMKENEAVKQSFLPTKNHLAFLKSYLSGEHDYGAVDLTGEGVRIYTKKE